MAKIDFPGYTTVDMNFFSLAYLIGQPVVTATSTTIEINAAPFTATFTGTGLVPVVTNGVLTSVTGGTLTGAQFDTNGALHSEIQNWNVSAAALFADLFAGKTADVLALTMSGNDDVTGTAGNDTLIGDAGKDTLQGGGGNDKLDGGVGHDKLIGGAGADSFVFDTKPLSNSRDSIADFTHGTDHIDLAHAIFAGIGSSGTLSAADFALGAATTASQHILYDASTGNLSYDKDGSGGLAAVVFAHVTAGLTVTASDFLVV